MLVELEPVVVLYDDCIMKIADWFGVYLFHRVKATDVEGDSRKAYIGDFLDRVVVNTSHYYR